MQIKIHAKRMLAIKRNDGLRQRICREVRAESRPYRRKHVKVPRVPKRVRTNPKRVRSRAAQKLLLNGWLRRKKLILIHQFPPSREEILSAKRNNGFEQKRIRALTSCRFVIPAEYKARRPIRRSHWPRIF